MRIVDTEENLLGTIVEDDRRRPPVLVLEFTDLTALNDPEFRVALAAAVPAVIGIKVSFEAEIDPSRSVFNELSI